MKKRVNWGIIGLGNIATQFAEDLVSCDSAILYGVASRNSEKSESFSTKFNAQRSFSSYEELLADPEIDIVYIATPHVFHFEQTMLFLRHNKHVLCEKPFSMNQSQTEMMIAEAKKRNLFLMEALWTQFLPSMNRVYEIIESGVIGKVEKVEAEFGFSAVNLGRDRLFNKSLGGGSLLDVGIYPIYLALQLLGAPSKIETSTVFATTGVDTACEMKFIHKEGASFLNSSFNENLSNGATITGSKGYIIMHGNFHQCTMLTICSDKSEVVEEIPYVGNGYLHEIEAVTEDILSGNGESSLYPLGRILELTKLLDRVRESMGLLYESDK